MPRGRSLFRVPSIPKRVAAFKSGLPGGKRFWRHRIGLKAPRGFGWFTNPKRALYNRVYNRTSIDLLGVLKKLLRW